jgi:hypothetical protein
MRKSTWVAGVLLVTSLTPAGAAVLCQKKSGAVFVRSACKKKEMALDVSGLGLVGPKLWVRVHFDGTTEDASSPQITVSHNVSGVYDVTFPQDVSACAPVASVHDTIELLATPSLNGVSGPTVVEVLVRNVGPAGPAEYADADFSLVLACP